MITYSANIVMLEYCNKVWEYEYMAFARRIGELWEAIMNIQLRNYQSFNHLILTMYKLNLKKMR